jgi:hypothetical protein
MSTGLVDAGLLVAFGLALDPAARSAIVRGFETGQLGEESGWLSRRLY